MSATALASSTLSSALVAGDNDFAVGSTANITVGQLIVCRNEAMKVQEIPVSGRVRVMRGWAGTEARAHASGTRFYIGAPDAFKAIQASLTAIVGNSSSYPDYLTPGQRARDGAGNEYVLCDMTTAMFSGTTVAISNDGQYTATILAGGAQGSVGIVVEEATSDQWGWVQIYGYNSYAQDTIADSAGTSTNVALACTTPSTPSVGLAVAAPSSAGQYAIEGMFIVGAATTVTTSASSATGVAYPVFLNYPFVRNYQISLTT